MSMFTEEERQTIRKELEESGVTNDDLIRFERKLKKLGRVVSHMLLLYNEAKRESPSRKTLRILQWPSVRRTLFSLAEARDMLPPTEDGRSPSAEALLRLFHEDEERQRVMLLTLGAMEVFPPLVELVAEMVAVEGGEKTLTPPERALYRARLPLVETLAEMLTPMMVNLQRHALRVLPDGRSFVESTMGTAPPDVQDQLREMLRQSEADKAVSPPPVP